MIRNNIDYNVKYIRYIHTYIICIHIQYTWCILILNIAKVFFCFEHKSRPYGYALVVIESSGLFDPYKLPTNDCISMCNDLWCNCEVWVGVGGQYTIDLSLFKSLHMMNFAKILSSKTKNLIFRGWGWFTPPKGVVGLTSFPYDNVLIK